MNSDPHPCIQLRYSSCNCPVFWVIQDRHTYEIPIQFCEEFFLLFQLKIAVPQTWCPPKHSSHWVINIHCTYKCLAICGIILLLLWRVEVIWILPTFKWDGAEYDHLRAGWNWVHQMCDFVFSLVGHPAVYHECIFLWGFQQLYRLCFIVLNGPVCKRLTQIHFWRTGKKKKLDLKEWNTKNVFASRDILNGILVSCLLCSHTRVIIDLGCHLQRLAHLFSQLLHLRVNAVEIMRHEDGTLKGSAGVITGTWRCKITQNS